MSTHLTGLLCLAIPALVGCTAAPGTGDGGTGLPPGNVFHLSIGPIEVDPGQDRVLCTTQRLSNDTPQFLRHIEASLGANSHHLIVYRVDDTEEDPTPTPCTTFGGAVGEHVAPLLLAQTSETSLDMPDGIGMPIAAGQMMRLEYHIVNTTSAPIFPQANITLVTTDPTSDLIPADLMFWGSLGINIPPHSPASVDFFHQPWDGVNIFGVTSHMHHLGVNATISLATDQSSDPRAAIDIQQLHHQTSWSETDVTRFSPALQLTPGQGLHLHCDYQNTTDQTVHFGVTAEDEMCFMWVYYYPSRGFQLCYEGLTDPNSTDTTCNPP